MYFSRIRQNARTRSQHVDYSFHCPQALLPAPRNTRLLDARHGIWMENLPSSIIHQSPPFSKNLPSSFPGHRHSPHLYWTITHSWNYSQNTRLYSRFKFKPSRYPCHGTTSWLHQCLLPRCLGSMGRLSVPSLYWKSSLYCHHSRLSCCIYISAHDWSWWSKIPANWSIPRPTTNPSAQTTIWKRHRRRITISLSIHSMITTYEQAFDTPIHVTPVCLLLKPLSVCFTFVKVLVSHKKCTPFNVTT